MEKGVDSGAAAAAAAAGRLGEWAQANPFGRAGLAPVVLSVVRAPRGCARYTGRTRHIPWHWLFT